MGMRWHGVLASGFGVGMSPVAPGTVGTLWGVALAWGLNEALPSAVWLWPACGVLSLAAVYVCQRATRGGPHHDPGWVVLDEIVAFPLALALVDVTFQTLTLGFLVFRFFDIVKLPPVRQFEALPGGWGIVADDIIAALYAAATLWIIARIGETLATA